MQTRTAAALALVAGGLAVVLVGADVAFNLDVRLEAEREGQWSMVAGSSGDQYIYDERFPGGCAGPHLRIVVDNGLPWPTEVHIVAHALNQSASPLARDVLYEDTWRLGRGEERSQELHVPEDLMRSQGGAPATTSVDVQVDDVFLHTCVEAA